MLLLGKTEVQVQDSQFPVQMAAHNATVTIKSHVEETFTALFMESLPFITSGSFVKVS